MRFWQRGLRLALGAFVLIFAAAVYLAMRNQPPPPKPPPAAHKLDPRAQSEGTDGTFTRYNQGKVEFTLHYDRVLEYVGGTSKVQGVKAILKTRDGDVEILADRATVGEEQKSFIVSGHTHVKSADGLTFDTDEASYTQGEGIVRAPGPVQFARGATHGSSVGLTYDQQQQILTLLDQARLTTQEAEGQPPAEAQAKTAVWARRDRTVRFDGSARIVRAGQTLEADSANLYLTADEQRVQRVELRGNSRITPTPGATANAGERASAAQMTAANGRAGATVPPPSGGQLRAMNARDINLMYSEDGQKLQQALLAGNGAVEVQAADGSGVTRIAGEFVDMGLDTDGSSLRTLLARGANAGARAELQLPPQADSPARVIRSAVIQGPSPGLPRQTGTLSSLRFSDDVEYRELPAPQDANRAANGRGRAAASSRGGRPAAPPAPRIAYARVLDLLTQPGLGSVDEARFSGNVRFKEGDSLQATSRDARYVMKTGQLDLSGAGPDGQLPKVIDDQTTIQASSIKLTPDSRKVLAEQSVQAEFKRSEKRADGTAVHTPSILSGDQPVLATSDKLDYDGSASRAVFTSKAKSRLWQPNGGTTIHGSEIILDDTTGNLWANGSVVSTMLLDQVDQKTKQTQKVNSEGRGDHLFYEDAARRATYTSNAHVKGTEGDLTSDKAILFLTGEGNSLDRLEATGHVELHTQGPEASGMRTATGERLVYTAANEQYVMTGKLVKYNDECNETQGKSLTFFRSVGTIIVDGNQQRRTEMRSAQGCKKEPLPH